MYDGQQAAWLSRADAGKTWAAKAQGVGSWIELDFPSSFAAVGSTSQSCGTHGNIFSDGPFNGSKTPYQCTTGGTAAEGSACVFPFTYYATTYNDCTSSGNNNVPWCYTVSGASINSPWGNCQDCNSNTLGECEARCALDSNCTHFTYWEDDSCETYSRCTLQASHTPMVATQTYAKGVPVVASAMRYANRDAYGREWNEELQLDFEAGPPSRLCYVFAAASGSVIMTWVGLWPHWGINGVRA